MGGSLQEHYAKARVLIITCMVQVHVKSVLSRITIGLVSIGKNSDSYDHSTFYRRIYGYLLYTCTAIKF